MIFVQFFFVVVQALKKIRYRAVHSIWRTRYIPCSPNEQLWYTSCYTCCAKHIFVSPLSLAFKTQIYFSIACFLTDSNVRLQQKR